MRTMNKYMAIDEIQPVLNYKQLLPTIVMWNRLEGRPRTDNFDRALKAEIRDPLFMLTKQWQMGEFRGDDAGSPVSAKFHMETTQLYKYKGDGHPAQPFEKDLPLETKVEHLKLPFKAEQQPLSLDIRMLMGRQWLKMTNKPSISTLKDEFKKAYPINKPDPDKRENAVICAHLNVWQQFTAAAGRAMDGAELYFYIKEKTSNHAYDKLTVPLTPAQETLIDKVAEKYITWFEKLFYQPLEENRDAWLPSKLEYQFACSAPKKGSEKVFTAGEYYQGHLDWYNMDVDKSVETLGNVEPQATDPAELEKTHTYSFFPAQLRFDGMPNTRWWAFEEGKTNFGDIKPDTTDLSKLLLMEFALVYANDWYIAPIKLPTGSVAKVRGLAVTNVFGERTWVEPTGAGDDNDWRRWTMYTLNVNSGKNNNHKEPADRSLLLLPAVAGIQESPPMEEILFIRDEMANMVWGIEARVLLPDGIPRPGREVARELQEQFQRILDKENGPVIVPGASKHKADILYRLMTTVPGHWIPFIPVHVKNDSRETQLQRASMPRILEGDKDDPKKIRPRTTLLRVGLDKQPREAYKLFEEEVPRSGVRVFQGYQRTRWYGGRVFTWLGVRKQVGRGEGAGGLKFDQIVPAKNDKS
ncbi:MAG: hypothetical protein GY940_39515 [bacterium]|nr:hypothetical protein [bacterium]